jgi:hypothetical protein
MHIFIDFSALVFPIHGFKLCDKLVQNQFLRTGLATEPLFAS